jgi:hypothetical protein
MVVISLTASKMPKNTFKLGLSFALVKGDKGWSFTVSFDAVVGTINLVFGKQ